MSPMKRPGNDYFPGTIGGKSGPKTPQGKAIAARNSTSHGLLVRDIVLPSPGEAPAGYNSSLRM